LLPKAKSKIEVLLEKGTDVIYQKSIANEPLHEELEMLRKVKKYFPQSGVYMLMPMELDIK
jgi:hypothetical protein